VRRRLAGGDIAAAAHEGLAALDGPTG
jgi:hypothetical protein